uniref:Uncharacterized protein n=1 Tax=Vitis vinifera TaxID=29760 RepID=A5BZ36_VITVI|nr:hypothetical protein VITISV_027547 [Vitis vinifera]
MATLHGSAPSLQRCAEGCVLPEEAITSLGQRMDGQQAQQVPVQESVQYDPTIPLPLPLSQTAPQDTEMPPPPPLGQTSQTKVAPLPAMVVVPTSKDTHARMDRLEQRMRQMRVSNGGMRWFVSLDVSRRRIWDDLAQEFLRQFAFNTVIDVSWRELEALRAFQKLVEGGLLTTLAPRPPPQPLPPQFRMDLHYAYYQGPRHDTDHCSAMRHAIQDLIDHGLVNLGQLSVTTNSLPAHTTHSVSPPTGGIHHMDFVQGDIIHMLSWDDGLLEMIVPDDGFEIVMTHSGRIAQVAPPVTRPFGGMGSREKVMKEDDEILRQLHSIQAQISIWSLLATSSTHKNALI